MSRSDTAEGCLRFMFTWSDASVHNDWPTIFEPVPFPDDVEVTQDLVRRYRLLRRNAPGWRSWSYQDNNHRSINAAAIAALLADAGRIDRRKAESPVHVQPTGRPKGGKVECEACGGTFQAMRKTARFCSANCRLRGHRAAVAPSPEMKR